MLQTILFRLKQPAGGTGSWIDRLRRRLIGQQQLHATIQLPTDDRHQPPPRLNHLLCFRATGIDRKVGTVRLALLQIDKEAAAVSRRAVRGREETAAGREGRFVNLQDVGNRLQSVEAKLPFRIGDDKRTVFEIEPDPRNPQLFRLLNQTFVTIGEDLPDDVGVVAEDSPMDLHLCTRLVGTRRAGNRLGDVDPIPQVGTDLDPDAVFENLFLGFLHLPNREDQCRPDTTGRIGHRLPIKSGGPLLIGKTDRQPVV